MTLSGVWVRVDVQGESMNATELRWIKVSGGYTALDGRVVVDLKSKVITIDDSEYPLPRRASFGHIEGILSDHESRRQAS